MTSPNMQAIIDKDKLTEVEQAILTSYNEGQTGETAADEYAALITERDQLRARVAELEAQGEPAGWQFYQDGKWWNGDAAIKHHRANTEAAGIPTRNLYVAPQPPADGPIVAALRTNTLLQLAWDGTYMYCKDDSWHVYASEQTQNIYDGPDEAAAVRTLLGGEE